MCSPRLRGLGPKSVAMTHRRNCPTIRRLSSWLRPSALVWQNGRHTTPRSCWASWSTRSALLVFPCSGGLQVMLRARSIRRRRLSSIWAPLRLMPRALRGRCEHSSRRAPTTCSGKIATLSPMSGCSTWSAGGWTDSSGRWRRSAHLPTGTPTSCRSQLAAHTGRTPRQTDSRPCRLLEPWKPRGELCCRARRTCSCSASTSSSEDR
mmetsp:Transcript_10126/g.25992  ORF Transcript_10126/g.25992 Transcript_10126/m.25992 type:complete len:207 (-) Transcript_10126:184-804(-)